MARSATAERRSLLKAFLAWKTILLALVLATCFLPSYDTSTSLFLDLPLDSPPDSTSHLAPLPSSLSDAIAFRLTRWDAFYFTAIAHRGYLFEQEWAFGPGLPYLVSKVLLPLSSLLGLRLPRTLKTASLVSIGVANVSHLFAVLLLHALARRLLPRRHNLAFVTGLLHVISPAGVFLSAPYSESLFACLSFAGYLLYVAPDLIPAPAVLQRGLSLVFSGALFGFATACRTNGILNGLVFAVELFSCLHGVVTQRGGSVLSRFFGTLPLIVSTIIGGVLVALGSVIPQGVAYMRFCVISKPRPWCHNLVPSIYAFVQEHYWGTGFLRYWTLPNLPLFLLAAPMLTILTISSYRIATQLVSFSTLPARLLISMALAQGLLALLTFTTYHVQVVTRLSSAYPVWYLWLAAALTAPRPERGRDSETGDGGAFWPRASEMKYGGLIVKYMIMYATVQSMLFACFLPPA